MKTEVCENVDCLKICLKWNVIIPICQLCCSYMWGNAWCLFNVM